MMHRDPAKLMLMHEKTCVIPILELMFLCFTVMSSLNKISYLILGTTRTSPVFTVCQKVIFYSLFLYFSKIKQDGILLSWTGPCGPDLDPIHLIL